MPTGTLVEQNVTLLVFRLENSRVCAPLNINLSYKWHKHIKQGYTQHKKPNLISRLTGKDIWKAEVWLILSLIAVFHITVAWKGKCTILTPVTPISDLHCDSELEKLDVSPCNLAPDLSCLWKRQMRDLVMFEAVILVGLRLIRDAWR